MRIKFRLLYLVLTYLFVALNLGCSGPDKLSTTGDVIIGVSSKLRVDVDVLQLHVVKKVNGQTQSDERLFSDGVSPFTFPLEVLFSDLPEGDDVEVEIEAFGTGTTPLLTRHARTNILANRKLLLRVDLSGACMGSDAPQCGDGQTCTSGICGPEYVHPALIEDYWPGWSKGPTDICKPNDGPPTVLVGKGMSDYLPVTDYDVAQLEAGPQGGHHIWVALRIKNLRQSGNITRLDGYVKELDMNVNPLSVIFTLNPAEGGYCKLYGLRFQLDGKVPVDQILGKTLEVTATVTEGENGDVGVGKKWVTLSSDLL